MGEGRGLTPPSPERGATLSSIEKGTWSFPRCQKEGREEREGEKNDTLVQKGPASSRSSKKKTTPGRKKKWLKEKRGGEGEKDIDVLDEVKNFLFSYPGCGASWSLTLDKKERRLERRRAGGTVKVQRRKEVGRSLQAIFRQLSKKTVEGKEKSISRRLSQERDDKG